jgi:hypothetical protein
MHGMQVVGSVSPSRTTIRTVRYDPDLELSSDFVLTFTRGEVPFAIAYPKDYGSYWHKDGILRRAIIEHDHSVP